MAGKRSPKGIWNGPIQPFITQSAIICMGLSPSRHNREGHNPEAFVLNDGRIVVYVIDGYYIADQVNGPWQYGKFTFNPRDRKIIEGLSNLSFAKRQDGSYLMVCRGGGIWISKDGIAPYEQITDKRVYPPVKGEFEDPIIWRDSLQYHASPEEQRQNYIAKGVAFTYALYPLIMPGNPSSARGR